MAGNSLSCFCRIVSSDMIMLLLSRDNVAGLFIVRFFID